MRIEVDTSDYAIGEVLSMEEKDGKWRPVAFLSKSLNKTERNYEIHDKEMLAIIRGLKSWRYLLKGAKFRFEIWTDHKNLEYFIKAQKLNQRQARWALYLSEFDFTLKHVPGTKMGKADGLSRRPDWKVGVDRDNENQVVMKNNWIRSLQEVVIEGPEAEMLEKIKKTRSKDEDVIRIVEEIKKTMLEQPLVTQGQIISQQAKLSNGLSSKEWELQENSTRSPHYIIYYIYTWLLVHTTTISIQPLSPCVILMSITHPHVFSIRLPCFLHIH